eukprot:CAMPEP_0206243266 /NCGR_PEP_ID=MMETSP0047_2-20121206/17518_1 /ASSEMBLY_ACC=CAM_ASM_000192 /TAXON_ID=195065 /ORGANISM="Chroomonas mesostigmatica_cf, Strain CCMP1168" /LENGTH=437 /DNA_ID=CAMNT_0053668379 /DNA_START=39 /DNA_END=1349 /DNA_ORIENTATION=+
MNSQTSRASSITLQDGTDAMVIAHCMRKGHGALECPVCLQLFQSPVKPVGAACKCTFCLDCFTDLVNFGGRCTISRPLPRAAEQHEVDRDVAEAIATFQREGGEDADYASRMNDYKRAAKGRAKGRRREDYNLLSMAELRLDPKPIATGAYGQVFRGVWEPAKGGEKQHVAVKKIFIGQNLKSTMDSFRKEASILAMLNHPHVLKMHGAVVEDDNVCIVTELVPGGSLFELIYSKPQLRPEAVIVIGQGVCKGMTYLHSVGIIHRDLKPGNLLMGAVQGPMGAELIVKVADFGLARVQDTARTMTGGIGTSQYTAPEVLRSERYDSKADIFSFGVILWEIHARKIPYSDMNQMQIAIAVATQDHRPPPPPNCPSCFWELMQKCWIAAPTNRPSFADVLSELEDMQFVFNLNNGVGFSQTVQQTEQAQRAAAQQQQQL